jgi:hypothetical protein
MSRGSLLRSIGILTLEGFRSSCIDRGLLLLDNTSLFGSSSNGSASPGLPMHPHRQSCRTPRVVRLSNMVMTPAGLGTKNDCASEDQQQFTRPNRLKTLTMNMVTAMFAETLGGLQHRTRRNPESRNHTLTL